MWHLSKYLKTEDDKKKGVGKSYKIVTKCNVFIKVKLISLLVADVF